MRNIFYIAAHDFCRLFRSPLGWVVLAVAQLLLALIFLLLLDRFSRPEAAAILASHGVTAIVVVGFLQVANNILLLVTPFVTMHAFSEEFRSGSIHLLLSAPVSVTELALGKYLALFTFFVVLIALLALMPLALLMDNTIDMARLTLGFLGLTLIVGAFAAIGLFISSLTRHPTLAAMGTFGFLFVLWIISLSNVGGSGAAQEMLRYISLFDHYHSFTEGRFNSVDVVYYLLTSALFVTLCVWKLDYERFVSAP